MFHLEACIHFQKVKTLILADNKLDGSGTLVLHCFGQSNGLCTHGRTGFLTDEWRRGFLNHLLVPTLDGALTLVEKYHMTVLITQDLNFYVTRFFNKFFNEHAVITKTVAGLIATRCEALQCFLVSERHTQPFSAPARRGFDHHRVANALRDGYRFISTLDGLVVAWNGVDIGLLSQLLRGNFVPHGGNGVVLGPNENQSFVFASLGKCLVFAQKSITGMDGLCPC